MAREFFLGLAAVAVVAFLKGKALFSLWYLDKKERLWLRQIWSM
jgi:hypothetical protein